MAKLNVVYWSGTGNTEAMANAIGNGIVAGGGEANVISVSNAKVSDLASEDVFALGCSSMGDEVLEETEMEPFVEELEKMVSGKKIALFGSYGWGDGLWMREWVKRMQDAGADIIDNEGLICNEYPGKDDIEKCEALGKTMALL